MPDLLVEIFGEEIPARMQDTAARGLLTLIQDGLQKNGLTHTDARVFYTPRRLTVHILGLPAARADGHEEVKGPRVGSADAAVQGFLKKNQIPSLDQCTVKNVDGADYYFFIKQTPGGPTAAALGPVIADAIKRLAWPKSMRWADFDLRWARPLHNVLAVFDGSVVPGELVLGPGQTIAFNNQTWGHRFMGPRDPIVVKDFKDYQDQLAAAFVILDPAARREKIWADVQALAAKNNLTVKQDEKLLTEVTGLVEYPVPFMGTFPQEFLRVPAEVISTSMREHQRYFSVLGPDGNLSNHFICVANIQPTDAGKTLIYGNEKVLRARLSDAQFFYDQDFKTPLPSLVPRLAAVRFHEKLGSMLDKSNRIEKLAETIIRRVIPPMVPPAEREVLVSHAKTASRLAKVDLVTGMVREFPELQGIMGGYYARAAHEPAVVADAIAHHYRPVGPGDDCPDDPVTVAVALADKIDTLVGFFSIGEKPTGSKDPFALRRAALGVIRLIVDHGHDLDLKILLDGHAKAYGLDQSPADLYPFILDRLKVVLTDQGLAAKVIEAVLAVRHDGHLTRLVHQVKVVTNHLESPAHAAFYEQLKRVVNILATVTDLDTNNMADGPVTPLDQALEVAIGKIYNVVPEYINGNKPDLALDALVTLTPYLSALFDGVMVMDPDLSVRKRRVHYLREIERLFTQIANPRALF